jgi:hypothetical protein
VDAFTSSTAGRLTATRQRELAARQFESLRQAAQDRRPTLTVTPEPSASPATPVENHTVDAPSLLAGLRAGPSLLASLIAHEVLGPPLALRPSGVSPRGVW